MIGERFIKPVLAVGALTLGGLVLNACGPEKPASNADVSSEESLPSQEVGYPDWNSALVYAPEPLTAEQAIEHYVRMNGLRTSSKVDAEVSADLADAYENQYGLDVDETFPGDPATGSQWISLDLTQ